MNTKELETIEIKPGEMYLSDKPVIIKTLLGSCISVTLYNPSMQVGAMCHGLLSHCGVKSGCKGRCDEIFKYLDCTINTMIELFYQRGIKNHEITAKVFGGADVIDIKLSKRTETVGKQNIEMTFSILKNKGIEVTASDTGGRQGRIIYFHSYTGEVFLKRIRQLNFKEAIAL